MRWGRGMAARASCPEDRPRNTPDMGRWGEKARRAERSQRRGHALLIGSLSRISSVSRFPHSGLGAKTVTAAGQCLEGLTAKNARNTKRRGDKNRAQTPGPEVQPPQLRPALRSLRSLGLTRLLPVRVLGAIHGHPSVSLRGPRRLDGDVAGGIGQSAAFEEQAGQLDAGGQAGAQGERTHRAPVHVPVAVGQPIDGPVAVHGSVHPRMEAVGGGPEVLFGIVAQVGVASHRRPPTMGGGGLIDPSHPSHGVSRAIQAAPFSCPPFSCLTVSGPQSPWARVVVLRVRNPHL